MSRERNKENERREEAVTGLNETYRGIQLEVQTHKARREEKEEREESGTGFKGTQRGERRH